MARAVHIPYPVPHRAPRSGRANPAFARATALGALLFVLSATGSLAVRVGSRLRLGISAWGQARRQRQEDRQLWELALADSRVMADLIALRQDAPGSRSEYF